MPWKETCVMHERIAFLAAYLRDEAPMSELCAAFGISRKTGYKWLARYRADGPQGLHDRSRAPRQHGRRMAPELADAILALRRDRPHWGPRKLRAVLCRQQPEAAWPAASTMGDLLRTHGLAGSRTRPRRLPAGRSQPFAAITQPNDVWCIDFKGWFRTADGTRCDPLTITVGCDGWRDVTGSVERRKRARRNPACTSVDALCHQDDRVVHRMRSAATCDVPG